MPQVSPIVPTIGRVVLVRLFDDQGRPETEAPAIVNGVHDDTISVCVMPEGMDPWPLTGLVYHQDDEVEFNEIDVEGVWRWMPYQLANDPQSKGAQTAVPLSTEGGAP